MIPITGNRWVEEIRKTPETLCVLYDIFYGEGTGIAQCFLINFYGSNWRWSFKNKQSQIFFSKKEALKTMKNNKVEWR